MSVYQGGKVARGITWFPEKTFSKPKADDIEKIKDVRKTDRNKDDRQWTQLHFIAAALTPPTSRPQSDVNVRGPDGITPLMVASYRGDELEVDVMRHLLNKRPKWAYIAHLRETSLHLAARYARVDAAKVLLDAGADCNDKDCFGRTPLHTAIAADAIGVFQILLRNRSTNLNAKMHDGTTPMILAVRMAVEGMVEELINADADIDATDEYGKTPLHWAAAVNNIRVAQVLLQHGANRDAQDAKDETPLFLAAREGSYETTKLLLDHYANSYIKDHMDQLPRDVAQVRYHQDILNLLDEYSIKSPANMALNGMPTSPSHLQFMQAKHSKQKKRQTEHNTPISPAGKTVNGVHQKKAKTKKKSTKASATVSQSSESSPVGTVSPGNSIESPMSYERTLPTYDAMYSNGNPYRLQMMEEVQVPQGCIDDQRAVVANHFDASPRLDQSDLLWHQATHAQSQSIPPTCNEASLTIPLNTMISNATPMGPGKMSPSKPGKIYQLHRHTFRQCNKGQDKNEIMGVL